MYGPYLSHWKCWKIRLQFVLEGGDIVSMYANLGSGKDWSRRLTRRMKIFYMAKAAGATSLSGLVNPRILWRVSVERIAPEGESGAYSIVEDIIGRES
jgi:hypothetical protein